MPRLLRFAATMNSSNAALRLTTQPPHFSSISCLQPQSTLSISKVGGTDPLPISLSSRITPRSSTSSSIWKWLVAWWRFGDGSLGSQTPGWTNEQGWKNWALVWKLNKAIMRYKRSLKACTRPCPRSASTNGVISAFQERWAVNPLWVQLVPQSLHRRQGRRLRYYLAPTGFAFLVDGLDKYKLL